MGRWRPPQKRGSPYITKEGAEKLQRELQHLWKNERPAVVDTVHEAAKNGDRSENGDYIYGKRRLAEIDRRVRYLSKRLDELNIVDRIPRELDKIFFGAWVQLENDEGEKVRYRIVGPDEFDIRENKLSMDSPMARALLGKRLDDEVALQLPEGQQTWWIVAIDYRHPES